MCVDVALTMLMYVLQQPPVVPKDPRRVKSKIWTIEICDLPVPDFKVCSHIFLKLNSIPVDFPYSDGLLLLFLLSICIFADLTVTTVIK